jgi:hypothetical protein
MKVQSVFILLLINASVFNRGYNYLFCSKLYFSHVSNRIKTDKCEGSGAFIWIRISVYFIE